MAHTAWYIHARQKAMPACLQKLMRCYLVIFKPIFAEDTIQSCAVYTVIPHLKAPAL